MNRASPIFSRSTTTRSSTASFRWRIGNLSRRHPGAPWRFRLKLAERAGRRPDPRRRFRLDRIRTRGDTAPTWIPLPEMEPWDRYAPTRVMEDEIYRGLPHPAHHRTPKAILSCPVHMGPSRASIDSLVASGRLSSSVDRSTVAGMRTNPCEDRWCLRETIRPMMISNTYLMIFAMAMTGCVLATPLVTWVATWVGAIDRPDQFRRIHKGAIPRLGGLALAPGRRGRNDLDPIARSAPAAGRGRIRPAPALVAAGGGAHHPGRRVRRRYPVAGHRG